MKNDSRELSLSRYSDISLYFIKPEKQQLQFPFPLLLSYIIIEALSDSIFSAGTAKLPFDQLPVNAFHFKTIATKKRTVALKYDGPVAAIHPEMLHLRRNVNTFNRVVPHVAFDTYCNLPFHNAKILTILAPSKWINKIKSRQHKATG